VPSEHGDRDFLSRVKGTELFSKKNYFKTVFASGGDLDAEIAEVKRKEVERFNERMVVDSKEFKVNKTIKSNNVIDKFKGILEDKAVKKGI
jgi:hypothetical protein